MGRVVPSSELGGGGSWLREVMVYAVANQEGLCLPKAKIVADNRLQSDRNKVRSIPLYITRANGGRREAGRT